MIRVQPDRRTKTKAPARQHDADTRYRQTHPVIPAAGREDPLQSSPLASHQSHVRGSIGKMHRPIHPILLAASTKVHEDALTTLLSGTSSLEVYVRPRPPFLHLTRCSRNSKSSHYLFTTWNRRTRSLSASTGLRFPPAIPCNSCEIFVACPRLHAALNPSN